MEKARCTMTRHNELHFRIFRLAMLGWLFGWLIKSPFFFTLLWKDVLRYPMHHPLFPEFFQSPSTSETAYLVPIVLAPLLFIRQRAPHVIYTVIITMCSVILMLHFNTCNDATFVASAWTGLWLILFAWHLKGMNADVLRHLKISGLCIIGLFFLGGFAGKLTPEFTSGETIYGIFFQSRPYWPHTWIRETLSLPQQHMLAGILAKGIIAVEGLLILAPLWPVILTFGLLSLTTGVMMIFCTYNILSVMSSLAGVCAACLLIERNFKFQK